MIGWLFGLFTGDETRACLDCAHHGKARGSNQLVCTHRSVTTYNHVTGKVCGYGDCHYCRSTGKYCGPGGRYWRKIKKE